MSTPDPLQTASGTAAIAVVAGLAAACLSAVSYLLCRHHVGAGGSGSRLLVLAHALMGSACLPVAWLAWPAALRPAAAWTLPLVGSACSYVAGQAMLFAALARADASRVAPLLGLKLAMLAGIVSCLPRPPLEPRQWTAVGLSLVAAVMLQHGGAIRPAAAGLTVAASASFAVSDLFIVALIDGLQKTASEGGVRLGRMAAGCLAMLVTYAACGAVAAGGLAILPAPWTATRRDWIAAARYAAAWLLAMTALYACFGSVGAVFGNVLQSTRGMMSIVIGAVLARAGWNTLESQVDRRTLARRLLAAALMTAAIALSVVDPA